jgi:hypothetical protein
LYVAVSTAWWKGGRGEEMHLDKWIDQLKGGMCISEMDLKRLCYHIKNLLIEEANVQPVRAPVTVS